jgi:16S rRNA (cytidine1402-2'-O)-methyltransferase
VATPIGNAADITLRALWVLAHCDLIAAEDTRNTAPLLVRFGIATPLVAVHEHNERASVERIVARLAAGSRIALVTDAGTPAIADPGARLVWAVLDAGHRVVPVPGASSAAAALSVAGLLVSEFRFLGFLPLGAEQRRRVVAEAIIGAEPFVLFEAPHRVRDLLALLAAMLEPARRVVLARELTKRFESLQVLRAEELAAVEAEERGEYVVVVDARAEPAEDRIDAVTQRWLTALAAELPASRVAAIAAKASGVSRAVLYGATLKLRKPG